MNGLVSVLGLACVNASFRERLLEEGGNVEALLPILLTGVEKDTLNQMTASPQKRDALYAAFSAVKAQLPGQCEMPPYCYADKDFSIQSPKAPPKAAPKAKQPRRRARR